MNNFAILLLSCKDQKGLVYKITKLIYELNGNIIDLDEHVDQIEKMFFVRVAWNFDESKNSKSEITESFSLLAGEFNSKWEVKFEDEKQNAAIFVSKYDHCLQEILWRNSLSELNINLKLIISNHPDLKGLAEHYKIPFYVFEINKLNKLEIELKELELLKHNNVELIVLARYMQILSPEFVKNFPNKIINIHHSFLPAFIGGNPYKQAFERGVKIIGATSHYVTSQLDEGPIIEQDIIKITHNDSLEDLITKGRDLERLVLARALLLQSQNRILVYGKKTIVF
ncbi:MAG: formyltetrahydrofolate deformylase [Ignavibacteriales bacterium]|nr:formyltetrahydrofolate deformylase [Ignavibacteriales bacterium]